MRAFICVSAGALAIATSVNADLVDVQFLGIGSGQTVKIFSPSRTTDVFVGQLQHHLSNGPAALNGDWRTYCSDLAQTVSGGATSYDIVAVQDVPDSSVMGAAKAQAIADMYAYAGGAQSLSTTSNDMATAFQLCIWEVVTDFTVAGIGHNLDMTAGLFSSTMTDGSPLSAGISAYVSAFLGAIGSNSASNQLGLRSGSYQDQIIEVPGPSALAAGAAGLLASRSRRRRG